MLENLLGGFIDKEQITHDTIQSTLEDVAEELGCNFNEFFIMIKPKNEKFEMRFDIYKIDNGKPIFIREITLKEILQT
jgi:hypothetical protein